MTRLRVLRGGDAGTPSLLLLHGLGATADVWAGLIAAAGVPCVAPDLPGHGGSPALPGYTFEAVAAAVADLVDPAGTVIVGHSFGGVVGLHLASRPGVRAVVGVGIKVSWTPDDLARAAALAARPAQVFPTRAEAVARYLRVSGLAGLVAPDDPALDAGLVETSDGWRLAFDQRAFGVGEPGVAALLAAAPVPVVLARGENDPMVSTEDLAALVPDPVVLYDLGHNAHVEAPPEVLRLVGRRDRAASEADALLHELCVDLGFCLPPAEQRRLRQSPPADVDSFTDAVFEAEGMGDMSETDLRRQVRAVVERHMRTWAG